MTICKTRVSALIFTIDGGTGDNYLNLQRPGSTAAVTLTFQPGSTAIETLPDGTTFTDIEHLYLITGSGNDSVNIIATF